VSLTLRDDNGAKASVNQEVNVNDASAISTLSTFAQGFASTLNAATGGVIDEIRLCLIIPLPGGIRSSPDANVDITQTGTFNFNDGTPYASALVVPALGDTLISGGQINLADQAVTDLVTWWTTVHSTHQIVSKPFHNLVTLVDGLFSFRKRRSAIARRSFPSV
jgi:hypothetical protein